jgi:hypothetical protein
LSFEQTESHREPAFVLFEWDASTSPNLPQVQVKSAPPDWPPAQVLAQGPSLTAPVEFDGPLTFLGYQVVSSNNKAIELETVWQVESTPGRPLSVMAHLLSADNRPVVTGDGLGVPVDQWQPGDVIVQRHTLTIPDATPPGAYWLQTGLYWLDTLERMPVKQSGNNTGDRILLTQVNVK